MKRILVDLDEKDVAHLNEVAAAEDVSRSSILRDAVAEYIIRKDRVPTAKPQPLEGFGALKGRLGDGLKYQENLRSDWE
ncbi:MAG: ribbon-helix-helix domain-containing protein [Luteolibacter sp.]|uniref:ribbon-helix-helix domain-containing protein n=1 Tax=Luteolibacter sp. TaxID=1962973 RepID=UPI003266813D